DDLVILGDDGTLSVRFSKLSDTLPHDAYRLPHLFHAHDIAVVTVAVFTTGDVEIEFGVAFIGLRLAQVPCRAGSPHHHAGKSPRPGVGKLDHPDIDVALL